MRSERSYHDLYVTTPTMERTQFSRLSFSYFVLCTRTAGWELWNTGPDGDLMKATLVAGEYHSIGLRLEVDGEPICDSLTETVGR